VFFSELAQGQTGLIFVTDEGAGGASFSGVTLRFLDQVIPLFPVENEGYYGLVAVPMEQTAREYTLDVFISFADGSQSAVSLPVKVTVGGFIRQDIPLKPDKTYLLDPEVEGAELARLESIFSTTSVYMLWDAHTFDLPIPGGTLTSPFGAFRTFNQTFQTRHTGWDIKAASGQPVLASADGVVVFTGFMEIRGSFVVIDHGLGVYSGYAHLSQVHVTRGQRVTRGQVLGTVGSTGRTSGAHFHWEVAVNGAFVDAAQFAALWLPTGGPKPPVSRPPLQGS
jgi:murein DD-endopeptidase MepM/ murein hydrolase activator NlpD